VLAGEFAPPGVVQAQEQHGRDFAAGACLYVGERLEALAGDAAVRRSADRYIARLAGNVWEASTDISGTDR
jgi:hypothetical protein